MKELIKQQTMSSREIAELTGKQHKDVLEAIRNMEPAWEKVTGRKFPLSEYKDSTGRKLPMYELSKKECLYVATKFNDEARAILVCRWEELESKNFSLDSITRKDLARMLLESEEEKERLQLTVAEQAPKVDYYEKVMSSDNLMSITEIAQNYGWTGAALNGILHGAGVQYKKGNSWFLTAKYLDKDYTRTVPAVHSVKNGKEFVINQTKWTETGRKFIHELLVENGFVNRQKSLML